MVGNVVELKLDNKLRIAGLFTNKMATEHTYDERTSFARRLLLLLLEFTISPPMVFHNCSPYHPSIEKYFGHCKHGKIV